MKSVLRRTASEDRSADKKRISAPKGDFVAPSLWVFRAESAHEKDDKAYQQNQAKPAAADDGTAEVKPAAAEQEKKNKYD